MNKISALIITHNPTEDLEYHLDTLFEDMDHIILVDNGSSSEIRGSIKEQIQRNGSNFKVIFNHDNLGVATALNQGFSLAIKLGYDHVVTLDQDSLPTPGMINTMLDAYHSHPGREKIAIIAPMVKDPSVGIKDLYLRSKLHFFFERKECTGQVLEGVSTVITSGSLHNLNVYKQVGPFRDDFFIDYVDKEYCLRAIQRGFKIVVACNAVLHHRLGDQQQKQIGSLTLRPTFHSPLRWYYINRNRIVMLGMYAFKAPYWVAYDIMVGIYAFLKMLLYEDRKLQKILAVMMGIFDGLFRRMGPIPLSRKRWLAK